MKSWAMTNFQQLKYSQNMKKTKMVHYRKSLSDHWLRTCVQDGTDLQRWYWKKTTTQRLTFGALVAYFMSFSNHYTLKRMDFIISFSKVNPAFHYLLFIMMKDNLKSTKMTNFLKFSKFWVRLNQISLIFLLKIKLQWNTSKL